MAKNNPMRAIDKLRQEVGAEEVIVTSSYDQYEDATAYKLGTSTMAVDMTATDWPWNGKGVVNTSRASNSFATQTYQPFGQDFVFSRRWDETPISANDNFDVGVLPNTTKWGPRTNAGSPLPIWDLYEGKMRFQTIGNNTGNYFQARTKYSLVGDFKLEFTLEQTGPVNTSDYFWMVMSVVGWKDTAGKLANWSDHPIGVEVRGTNTSLYHHGSTGSAEYDGWGTAPWGSITRLKVERIGTTVTWYRKNGGVGDWVLERAAQSGCTQEALWPKFFFGGVAAGMTVTLDDWVAEPLNTGSLVWDTPQSGASWSSWITIKDAEVQAAESLTVATTEATTAVTNHETSYDHTTFITQATAINPDQKGVVNGVATLDGTGLIPTAQLPPLAITDVNVVADIAARDALVPQEGDVAVVTASDNSFIYDGTSWQEIMSPNVVASVNGYTGIVSLTASDVGASADSHDHSGLYEIAGAATSAVSTHEITYDHTTYVTQAALDALPSAPTVQTTAPTSPSEGDLWVDTSV